MKEAESKEILNCHAELEWLVPSGEPDDDWDWRLEYVGRKGELTILESTTVHAGHNYAYCRNNFQTDPRTGRTRQSNTATNLPTLKKRGMTTGKERSMDENCRVDFEAGERLWGGKTPRAMSHLPAEPTVTGFSPDLKIERFGVAKSEMGSLLES